MNTKILRRFLWPVAGVIAVLIIGTIGYYHISGGEHSLLDTFYMTVITISTIGFGEVIDLSASPAGRVFTIFIAIAGIGFLFYIITNLTAFVVEGELTKSFRRRKMEKRARSFSEHYIVCGMGEVGIHVAHELAATNRPFIALDINREHIEKALEAFPNMVYIEGDATDDNTLLKAGIKQARGIFITTAEDNQNLVVTLTVKQLNPEVRIISRCNELKNGEKMRKAGADAVISPCFIGGLRMASEMVRPTVVSFLDTMLRDKEKNLRVEEVSVPDSLNGKTISEIRLNKYPGVLLLAVKTGEEWTYNPAADFVIRPESRLVFIGSPRDRAELEKSLVSHQ